MSLQTAVLQSLHLMMRMAAHSTLASFDPEVEDWVEYTDQLSYCFTVNGLIDNTKKLAIFVDQQSFVL